MTDRRLERVDDGEWAFVASLLLAGLGVAVASPILVVGATIPLWYGVSAGFGTPPDVRISSRRTVTRRSGDAADEPRVREDGADAGFVSADPGDTVAVRTTVRNTGAETIVDLRVVDDVPDALSVVSGTSRRCETLEPGDEAVLEYELAVHRGEHTFGDLTVRARNVTGTVAETWSDGVGGDDEIRCLPTAETVPLGEGTNDYAGEVPTDEGGSGVEFYSVREYEPGDPVGSIDWRRYAGTRELATVEYRAERATRIVCVVDVRSSQFRAATTERPPAAELSAEAARRTADTLLDEGHPTGVVGIADRRITTVPPDGDTTTRRRIRDLLEAARRAEFTGEEGTRTAYGDPVDEVPRTLPGEAQVYLFSSFVDDEPVELLERLRTHGYAVRVVSPDVTAGPDALETRLEGLDRRTRLARARATGARVVDWDLERSFGLVLSDAVGEAGVR
ncbi:DUF58 domain-containing protein [Natrialba sp. INN-245]|uniref:DUF58 domain-containing protein n=1 Tax=Natrialba sp. INN-245 TaxID=2690967 RepID=UPI0013114559|nr:DUF58 domain-containing protein [Natrialba sp. INN-245]